MFQTGIVALGTLQSVFFIDVEENNGSSCCPAVNCKLLISKIGPSLWHVYKAGLASHNVALVADNPNTLMEASKGHWGT